MADGFGLFRLTEDHEAICDAVRAVQVLGGAGYTSDWPVERMMRAAKITQIYQGTNQIQRMVIARQLLR